MNIGTHIIGQGHPCYIIAELSANHAGDFEVAAATIRAMQAVGASTLSIDAGKTLMIEGDGVISAADAAGIAIVGRRVSSAVG